MLAIHSPAESGTAMTFKTNSEMMKPLLNPHSFPHFPDCLQVDVVCTEYVEENRVPILRLCLIQVFDVWCCSITTLKLVRQSATLFQYLPCSPPPKMFFLKSYLLRSNRHPSIVKQFRSLYSFSTKFSRLL